MTEITEEYRQSRQLREYKSPRNYNYIKKMAEECRKLFKYMEDKNNGI